MFHPTPQNTGTQTVDDTYTDVSLHLEGMYQVILFNDDVNTTEHVVSCLMDVFGHSQQLAEKLMLDAHRAGRTVVEVEPRELAQLHKYQLQSYGLTAAVEKVD